jgi:hypothetical protein
MERSRQHPNYRSRHPVMGWSVCGGVTPLLCRTWYPTKECEQAVDPEVLVTPHLQEHTQRGQEHSSNEPGWGEGEGKQQQRACGQQPVWRDGLWCRTQACFWAVFVTLQLAQPMALLCVLYPSCIEASRAARAGNRCVTVNQTCCVNVLTPLLADIKAGERHGSSASTEMKYCWPSLVDLTATKEVVAEVDEYTAARCTRPLHVALSTSEGSQTSDDSDAQVASHAA